MDERRQSGGCAAQDAATEAAVLQLVLALHPSPLSREELLRELAEGAGFERRDAVERAIRDLAGAGLLHRSGELVLPTRAALRCDELLGR